MPISKAQALAAASTRDSAPYEQFCEKIDRSISANAGTSRLITMSTSGVERHVVDRAIQAYRALGWKCDYMPDQRDGDYLQLS